MLKYTDAQVCFREVPDEISLCINISNCPCNCIGCHSAYLAEDIGEPLTEESLKKLIDKNEGITCVAFMGGDSDPDSVIELSAFVKDNYELKTAWYSGREVVMTKLLFLDYLKLGPYKEECGPLDSKTTNQRMFRVDHRCDDSSLCDITHRFWEKE